MNIRSMLTRIIAVDLVLTILLVVGSSTALAAEKCETFQANAIGTSNQSGNVFPIKFWFCKPTTPEQRQAMTDAFKKDKSQGLSKALDKMPSSGRISTPLFVGYDIVYYRLIPTATGHQIRFLTNRLIAFGDRHSSARSTDHSLTAGLIDVNDNDRTKSKGILYPAAELKMNEKTNELTWELRMNPWRLQDFLDFAESEPE
jgi:hypothetical protein